MEVRAIDEYYSSKLHKPFYMVVGDEEYKKILENLRTRAISIIHVSDCCNKADKLPDLDALREKLETADVSCQYNKVVLVGLGEYLALCGNNITKEVLGEFSNFNLGSAQAVLLLRCIDSQVEAFAKSDRRLLESGRIAFGENLSTSVSFKFSDPNLGLYQINGIKGILAKLEEGFSGVICANTVMPFKDSLLPVQHVRDSFDALSKKLGATTLKRDNGSEEMWSRLLADLRQRNYEIDALMKEYGLMDIQDSDYYELLYGDEYKSWLFFISLMLNIKSYEEKYVGYVLKSSNTLSSFKHGILSAIMEISYRDKRYSGFYRERKRLLSNYPEPEMASFISENRKNDEESIYRLTDNTFVERQEIIIWIAKHDIPDNLAEIYPDLAAYLKKYSFNGKEMSASFAEHLTAYFEEYKKLKIKNTVTDDFSDTVDILATEHVYNQLPKRDELVKWKDDGKTQLFWIDALGVEYLAYIVELAKRYGLKIDVEIGRADLPTITCENKSFFENWPEQLRHLKEEDLDGIKHKGKFGYYYGPDNPYPIHIAKELSIISRAVSDIATTLGLRKYDSVLLASDHGASRLAVLKDKEEKYDTDTRGQHSGRCCAYFEGCDIPSAIIEKDKGDKGYIVLADYGRFKGSRKANVEVHGGASLEEVIVPVITFSLNDTSIVISVVDEDKIKADFKTGIKVKLYINKSVRGTLTLGYLSKRYAAKKLDDNHYMVEIPEIKRAGKYPVDIYIGDNLTAHLEIKVSGKSATMNDDFNDLF